MIHAANEPGRVERKRAARVRQILERAMEIVAQEGLERLTVTRLAEALDYTPGALYRYFPSKDALLAGVQRQAIDDLRRAVQDAVQDVPVDEDTERAEAVLRPLCALAERFLLFVDDRPHQVQLINALLAEPRDLITDGEVAITSRRLLGVMAEVETLVAVATNEGALSPGVAEDRTVALWAALQSATQLTKMRRFAPRFQPQSVGRTLYRTLLLGWGADPTLLAQAIEAVAGESS